MEAGRATPPNHLRDSAQSEPSSISKESPVEKATAGIIVTLMILKVLGFIVNAAPTLASPRPVEFTQSDGTARAGDDYASVSGTLTLS
jgi:hypothetical protein